MKKNNVEIGATYLVKVGQNLVPVVVVSENEHGGWNGESAKTGKAIRIKSAQRLRKRLPAEPDRVEAEEATVEPDGASAPKANKRGKATTGTASPKQRDTGEHGATQGPRNGKRSALDAAAEVLADMGEPMNCKTLIDTMADRGLWSSPGGKTPANTLYAAIAREIKVKGNDSRFAKGERGMFTFAGKDG